MARTLVSICLCPPRRAATRSASTSTPAPLSLLGADAGNQAMWGNSEAMGKSRMIKLPFSFWNGGQIWLHFLRQNGFLLLSSQLVVWIITGNKMKLFCCSKFKWFCCPGGMKLFCNFVAQAVWNSFVAQAVWNNSIAQAVANQGDSIRVWQPGGNVSWWYQWWYLWWLEPLWGYVS